jgi:flagellar biosynthetic protein FliO
MALGAGAVAAAQGSESQARPAAANAVGTARSVDETTLSLSDGTAQAAAANGAAGTNTLAYFLRMVVVLVLVLAAIYGAYRLFKKFAKPKAADDSAVRILSTSSLGQGRALHVIGVGAKSYLVGATDSSISLIAEIDDKEFVDALVLKAETEARAKPGKAADFGAMLSGLMSGRKSGREAKRGDGDFLAGQRDRLRKF